MRINFDYEINDISDIENVTSFIKNVIDTKECHITSANLYLSIKNKDNDACYIGDTEGNKVKYIVRDKPYKSKNKSVSYTITDSNSHKKLYIYEVIDKT
jgi:hypothetical protein